MLKLKSGTIAYTIQEVAEAMKRSPATIRRYIKSGAMKAQKIGTKWYVTDQVFDWVMRGDIDALPSVVLHDPSEEVKQ